jgi:hypothetical protein
MAVSCLSGGQGCVEFNECWSQPRPHHFRDSDHTKYTSIPHSRKHAVPISQNYFIWPEQALSRKSEAVQELFVQACFIFILLQEELDVRLNLPFLHSH